jgi:vancomycin resistance protein VanJ
VIFGDRFWWLSLLNTFAHLLFLPLLLFVPLALLIRTRQPILRMLPVMLIGGLWFGPYFLPKNLPTPTGSVIRVLTLNVWGNNNDLSRIETWVREVNADIVLLQEISPAYATDSLPNLIDLYPYQFSQPDSTRWGGIITLSRYPIVENEYVDLQVPPEPQRSVIDINGQRIAVYNVHLAWPVSNPRIQPPVDSLYWRVALGFDDGARNQQITNLLDHLEKEPYPYLVGGDFNTSDQSATYNRIAAQMHDTFREAGVGFGASWPVSAARGLPAFLPPLIRIDYLWHSEGFRTLKAHQPQPVGSDHLPLQVELEISAANSSQ